MAQIDYYFATISPFTYLAGTRLEAIAAKHGASITYKPLDVVDLFGRKAYRLQEMRRQAVKAALPLTLQPKFWPANPAPSSYAIIAAQAAGGGDPGGLVHAITRACWAEEKNIAEDDVIREALEGAGFDPALTDTGLLASAETYAANLEEAVSRGVFGAPFYVVGEERFWGQDRLADLDLYLAGKL